jgi:hypothetical protein
MAAVVIDSGPIEAERLLRNVPRDKWRELMLARRRFLDSKLSYDCRCLVQFVNDARQMFEALGFASAEAMIRDGYGLKPNEIKIAVDWLELNPPGDPISLDEVRRLAGREIGISGGKPGPGRGKKTGSDTTRFSGRGTGYILARLDRDRPELAAKVRAGKLSANAAAIEAGFRKQSTPIERALKLLPKLTRTELRHLRARIDEALGEAKGKRAA